jgi:predicted Zn-dependent protease
MTLRSPSSTSLVALVAASTIVVFGPAAGARAQIDCAQCKALCSDAPKRAYPDEPSPESPRAAVAHKSGEAETLFVAAKRQDPAFGGTDVRAAVDGYRRAVALDPDNAQYRNHLAAGLLRAGRPDEAAYNLEAAVRLVPSEPKYIVNLGYAHHKRGDETHALLYYLRALALDPRDVRARLFTGYALELLSYPDEAALELKKVLAQDPTHDGAKKALARLDRSFLQADERALRPEASRPSAPAHAQPEGQPPPLLRDVPVTPPR